MGCEGRSYYSATNKLLLETGHLASGAGTADHALYSSRVRFERNGFTMHVWVRAHPRPRTYAVKIWINPLSQRHSIGKLATQNVKACSEAENLLHFTESNVRHNEPLNEQFCEEHTLKMSVLCGHLILCRSYTECKRQRSLHSSQYNNH